MARFSERFLVMTVRAKYAGPYSKHKYVNLTSDQLATKATLIKYLNEVCAAWNSGQYFFKAPQGPVFMRFDVYEGKIVNLYKVSPITGEPYPLWNFVGVEKPAAPKAKKKPVKPKSKARKPATGKAKPRKRRA